MSYILWKRNSQNTRGKHITTQLIAMADAMACAEDTVMVLVPVVQVALVVVVAITLAVVRVVELALVVVKAVVPAVMLAVRQVVPVAVGMMAAPVTAQLLVEWIAKVALAVVLDVAALAKEVVIEQGRPMVKVLIIFEGRI